jgi:hypothetical protein
MFSDHSEHLVTSETPDPWPTEADVDAVLEEFGGDARAALRALLHDLAELAADYDAWVSKGYVRSRAGGFPHPSQPILEARLKQGVLGLCIPTQIENHLPSLL